MVEERGDHATGAWDEEDQKLRKADARFQPHLVHDLLEGGVAICRPELFREGACLINLFLETFADSIDARLVRPHTDLTHERLYEMATGLEAPAEGPLPVSLKEADVWVRKWRSPFHAVNLQGELVHRWRPEDEGLQANTHLKKGPSVWRVIVHDEHAFTVPRDWSTEQKFDSLVAGQAPKTQEQREERRRRELEGSLGQDLPCAKLYHHPTKPEPLTANSCAVVDCANDCLEILEDEDRKGVKMAITGAEPDELIIELWEGGFEPKITQMKFGVAEAFVVQMGRRSLYVRRAVDGETRGDQPCVREDFALESQRQFDETLFRLRETVMPRNGLSRYSPTMATRVNAAAHRALHPDQGLTEFRVGDVLRGASGGCRCRGGRINSSALYEVVAVGDTHIKVRGRDDREKEPPVAAAAKALVRPHARTNHAAQGSSIDGRIYVHDWNTPMATHVWLRTAVSRSTTCDVVLVDTPARQRYPAAGHIAARIANHRATDIGKGMAFEEADYVAPDWVRDQFKRQRFACAGCQEPIDGETDWSIDRVNNALPHTQENCSCVCRHCQNASGHRERQQAAAQRHAENVEA